MPVADLSILCAINGIRKSMCLNTRRGIDTTMAGMAITATVGTKTGKIMGKAEVMAKAKTRVTAETKKNRLNCCCPSIFQWRKEK